ASRFASNGSARMEIVTSRQPRGQRTSTKSLPLLETLTVLPLPIFAGQVTSLGLVVPGSEELTSADTTCRPSQRWSDHAALPPARPTTSSVSAGPLASVRLLPARSERKTSAVFPL